MANPTVQKVAKAEVEIPKTPIQIGYEFRLPGGYRKDGIIVRDVTMAEMTGVDEENIASPAVAGNGGKAITVLLANVVKKLGSLKVTEELIRSLYIGDRDFLMIKLRIISIGEEYTTEVTCPKCKAKFGILVNLKDIEVKEVADDEDGTYPFELTKGYVDSTGVSHKQGLIKLPTGIEQEYLSSDAARNPGVATTQLLTRCCAKLGTLKMVTNDIIRNLITKDREIMARTMRDKMPGPVLEADTTCVSCGNKWISPLTVTDFFVPTPRS